MRDFGAYPAAHSAFLLNIGLETLAVRMALGVVEAVKESGKPILVVGVDGIGEAYDSIRRGELSATIDSFPKFKGQIAVEAAIRVLGGQKMPRVIWTPQALIDSTNVNIPAEQIIHWTEPIWE